MDDQARSNAIRLLGYLEAEVQDALHQLELETLRAVLRAAAVAAVEGDAPGFGTAASAQGVKKHKRLVQAIAQPVKRRQAEANLSAVLAALPAPLPPPPPPPPPPLPAPAPPAPLPAPPASPAPAHQPLEDAPTPQELADVEEADADADAEPEAQPEEDPSPKRPTRAHTRARTREQEDAGPTGTRADGCQAAPDEGEGESEEDLRLLAERQRAADAAAVLEDMLGEGLIHAGQARAAVLIAMGSTFAETARISGNSQRAIYDWRRQPHFQEAVARVTAYLAMRLVEDIQGAQRLALDTLIEGLSAMKPSFGGGLVPDWQARQRCADSLLDRGGRLLKGETLQVTQQVTHSLDEDLDAKLAALERERLALEREQEAIDEEFAELRLLHGGRSGESA